jgi:hypothetical protein
MPIRFSYDQERRILFTTAEGVLSLAEILRHLDEEGSARALGYKEIIDACTAKTNLTVEEVRQLERRLEALMRACPFGPTAIISTNDVVYGMFRMLSTLSELRSGPKIGVFRSAEDGLAWLQNAS